MIQIDQSLKPRSRPRRLIGGCRFDLGLDLDFVPDVMHLHDWPTALVAAYLDPDGLGPAELPFERTASVLTIHNVEYQGKFPPEALPWMGLPPDVFRPDRIEDFGGLNLLKCGIAYADELQKRLRDVPTSRWSRTRATYTIQSKAGGK